MPVISEIPIDYLTGGRGSSACHPGATASVNGAASVYSLNVSDCETADDEDHTDHCDVCARRRDYGTAAEGNPAPPLLTHKPLITIMGIHSMLLAMSQNSHHGHRPLPRRHLDQHTILCRTPLHNWRMYNLGCTPSLKNSTYHTPSIADLRLASP